MNTEKDLDIDSNTQEGAETKVVGIAFSGKAGAFFSIWIVNVLLSIITLGIYSAWATVRTKSYFYGNTTIDGHVFSFLATPMQILRGRVLAVVLLVIYSVVSEFFPMLGLALLAVLLIATPWLIVQSLRFNHRMTSYRNVRFDFTGTYGGAFVNFLLLPIVAIFTLYLTLPWVLKRMNKYMLENTYYGKTKLSTEIKADQFYATYLLVFIISAVFLAVVYAVHSLIFGSLSVESLIHLPIAYMVFLGLAYFVFMSIMRAVIAVQIRNYIFNNSEFVGLARFKSNLKIKPYAYLDVTNALALIFSLGLAYPWVAIRTTRYLAQCTQVEINLQAAQSIDSQAEQHSAFGVEAADSFDVGASII